MPNAMNLAVQVKNLAKVAGGFRAAPKGMKQTLSDAGTLAGYMIMATKGVRIYPPAGPGNRPGIYTNPYPYYVRGVGTQTSARHNLGNSEKLGSKMVAQGQVDPPWFLNTRAQSMGGIAITLGTAVSYAPYVVGDDQSAVMAHIGWVKLADAARAKLPQIGRLFESMLGTLFKQLGL